MNINYDKKKRKRRGADDNGDAAYNHWYTNSYLPWYQNYQHQMQQYQQALQAYEAAKAAAEVPSNPFGNYNGMSANGMHNNFYTLSKQGYNQHLYDQVVDTDPSVTHLAAFGKWACERLSTRVTDVLFIDSGEACWDDATSTCIDDGADGSGGCTVAIPV
jgi:hypothetical protein